MEHFIYLFILFELFVSIVKYQFEMQAHYIQEFIYQHLHRFAIFPQILISSRTEDTLKLFAQQSTAIVIFFSTSH